MRVTLPLSRDSRNQPDDQPGCWFGRKAIAGYWAGDVAGERGGRAQAAAGKPAFEADARAAAAAALPRLAVAYLRLVGNLPPRSRLRQAALWRGMRQAVEAFNRRDLDVVTIAYDPDLEYYPYREFVEATLADRCYRGSSGYRSYIGAQNEVWGDDVRLEPTELIDLGDRLVLLGGHADARTGERCSAGREVRRCDDTQERQGDPR